MTKFALGFILGLFIATGVIVWQARHHSQSVVGQPTGEIVSQTTTPETRTVYVYRDAKKPAGAAQGAFVLTAVKTKGGTATALLGSEGYTSIVLQTDPAPWFARSKELSGSLYFGVQGSSFVTRGAISRDIWQVKNAYVGVVLAADKYPNETRAFIGIGLRF